MSNDEVIRRLEGLKAHIPDRTPEEQDAIDQEIASIDNTIQEYTERISFLEGKTSDLENYKYSNTEPREFTEELLEESFARQLEELDREDEEYKELQSIGDYILNSYIEEIETLNEEIVSIERRLRKNDLAVSKNMRIQLSIEEVQELNDTLESKRARLSLCESMREQYSTDLNDYSSLLAANEQKRQLIVAKQDRLQEIKENKQNMINHAKLLDDRAEIIMLKSGIDALESKKESLSYDKRSEIDAIIEEIKNSKSNESIDDTKDEITDADQTDLDDDVIDGAISSDQTDWADDAIDGVISSDQTDWADDAIDGVIVEVDSSGDNTNDLDNSLSEIENNDISDTVYADTNGDNAVDIEKSNKKSKKKKSKKDDYTPCFMDEEAYRKMLLAEEDLDDEREAVIEDSGELKDKKKDNKVMAFIRENKKRFIAAGLALVVLATASIKGCSSLKQLNSQQSDELDNDGSYSQQYIDDDQTGLDNDTFDGTTGDDQTDLDNDTFDGTTGDDQTDLDNDTFDGTTGDDQTDLGDNSTGGITDDDQTDLGDNSAGGITDDDQTDLDNGTVILDEGESVTNVSDIFGGSDSVSTQTDSDTVTKPVISHGDEVGTQLDSGTELTDYTEDGKAVVELGDTKTTVVEDSDKSFHEMLEDFFGGPITITDAENSYDQGEIDGPSRTR